MNASRAIVMWCVLWYQAKLLLAPVELGLLHRGRNKKNKAFHLKLLVSFSRCIDGCGIPQNVLTIIQPDTIVRHGIILPGLRGKRP